MNELMKVKKATARRAFNAGYDIIVIPSKVEIERAMFRGARISNGYIDFDEYVNHFEDEHCYKEIGLTARFYMYADDLIEFDKKRLSKGTRK